MIYALDTNIISYFIQDNPYVISQFRGVLAAGHSIIIPPAVYYEVRRGFSHKSSGRKERAFVRMCSLYPVGEMSLPIWGQAADIYGYTRKAGNPIEDTDILIAAFCIANGYTLVTNNVRHFNGIKDLKLVNWAE